LGDGIPIHFTAFHPDFKMRIKDRTPERTLSRARKIALNTGIKYCYVGNIHHTEGQTTYCPNCKEKLIKRNWHSVISNSLINSKCSKCGEVVEGVFA
jgi:pyruvate formate lyase activating enzyme